MFASASGELYTRAPPNSFCSPHVTLKTPPLPLTLPRCSSRDTSATSSPKMRIFSSRRISSFMQALSRSTIVVGIARELRIVLRVELLARRIDVGRVDVVVDRLGARLRLRERVVGRREHFGVDLFLDLRELGVGRVALRDQPLRELRDRIARRVRLALGGRTVHHFVVGQRVRVRTNHVRVHERRSLALRARSRPPRASPRSWRRDRSRRLPRCSRSGNDVTQLRDAAARRCSPRPAPRSRSRCLRRDRRPAA